MTPVLRVSLSDQTNHCTATSFHISWKIPRSHSQLKIPSQTNSCTVDTPCPCDPSHGALRSLVCSVNHGPSTMATADWPVPMTQISKSESLLSEFRIGEKKEREGEKVGGSREPQRDKSLWGVTVVTFKLKSSWKLVFFPSDEPQKQRKLDCRKTEMNKADTEMYS